MAESFDPIAVVESAYDIEGSMDDWLLRIAQSVRPELDFGYGSIAAMYGHREWNVRLDGAAVCGAPPGMREFLDRILSAIPQAGAQSVHSLNSRLSTFSEATAESGDLSGFFSDGVVACDGLTLKDWKAVLATDGGPWLLMVGGMSPEWERTTPTERRTWQRIAAHLMSAARLVRTLSVSPLRESAVLDPAGNVLHAEVEAKPRNIRERLRDAAQRMDCARGRMRHEDPMGAIELWRALVDGRWSLVDRFEHDSRRLLVAVDNESPHRDPRRLTRRQRQVAHLAMQGLSNKEIGYALGSSESAVGTHLSAILRKLRLMRREQLTIGAGAPERVSAASVNGRTIAVGSYPNVQLPSKLTSAERAVVQAVAEGLRDREIADCRGVSPRTVANQLRSVFRKLGVRSRAELMAHLNRSD